MNKLITVTVFTLILMLASSATVLAAPTADYTAAQREQVELALSSHERIPNKEALLRYSELVDQILRDIISQPSKRALARSRAIFVLRLFPSPASATVLKQAIEQLAPAKEGVELLDLGVALGSYGVVVGPPAVSTIKPFLSHVHPDLRIAAAEAIRLSRSPQTSTLIRGRLKIEPEATVKLQLEKQLKLLKQMSKAK